MTCDMSLRVLNIPKAMHAHLMLGNAYPVVNGRRTKRCTIHIRSPDGVRHPVDMVAAAGTHHHRFSQGWKTFCSHARVRIGDTIDFRRTNAPDELDTFIARKAAL